MRGSSLADSFNEAGADAPEIQEGQPQRLEPRVASMRPGRMPRKYNQAAKGDYIIFAASMRPGRMPRKYVHLHKEYLNAFHASMRPGRMPRKYQ